MLEYRLSEALGNAAANSSSRWLGRQEPRNRVEPECWPTLNPRFKIRSDARVFTVGSCFARGIEYHLAQLGLDVPVYRLFTEDPDYAGLTNDMANTYTPPAIFQELSWAATILDRDDTVRMDDIEPLLFELSSGKFVDLWRPINHFSQRSIEILARRKLFYRIFREAFLCDITVMTLGLIECWWDREGEQYVELPPSFSRLKNTERFVFRRIDYPEAYRYVRQSLELLNRTGDRHILLTTSPVPLARTFMPDDVIVANTYSKSVLRAVSGRIVEEFDWVDYFPSFESVMLTKQREVWDDDLIHIQRSFVGRIMTRVIDNYLDDPSLVMPQAPADWQLHFSDLVRTGQLDEAALHYDRSTQEGRATASIDFRASAVEMLVGLGRLEEARAVIDQVATEITDELHVAFLWRLAPLYEKLGRPDRAEETRQRAYDICSRRPSLVAQTINRLHTTKKTKDLAWLMAAAEREDDQKLVVLERLASIYHTENRLDDAERAWRRCIEIDPFHEGLTLQLGFLLHRQGKLPAMCELYEKYLANRPNCYVIRRQLGKAYGREALWDKAEEHLKLLISADEADADCYVWQARLDLRAGRLADAESHAQRALDLAPDREHIRNFHQQVSRQIAARTLKRPNDAPP